MANRPITDGEAIEIRRLLAEGVSKRAISRSLDRDDRTIRKFLARQLASERASPRAVSEAAKAVAREHAEARALRPASITAKPFSIDWWDQNDASFAAGFAGQQDDGVRTPNHDRRKAGRG